MSTRLVVARQTLSKSQDDAMTCAKKDEISTALFESVDEVVHRNGQVEALLEEAEQQICDDSIAKAVKDG